MKKFQKIYKNLISEQQTVQNNDIAQQNFKKIIKVLNELKNIQNIYIDTIDIDYPNYSYIMFYISIPINNIKNNFFQYCHRYKKDEFKKFLNSSYYTSYNYNNDNNIEFQMYFFHANKRTDNRLVLEFSSQNIDISDQYSFTFMSNINKAYSEEFIRKKLINAINYYKNAVLTTQSWEEIYNELFTQAEKQKIQEESRRQEEEQNLQHAINEVQNHFDTQLSHVRDLDDLESSFSDFGSIVSDIVNDYREED